MKITGILILVICIPLLLLSWLLDVPQFGTHGGLSADAALLITFICGFSGWLSAMYVIASGVVGKFKKYRALTISILVVFILSVIQIIRVHPYYEG